MSFLQSRGVKFTANWHCFFGAIWHASRRHACGSLACERIYHVLIRNLPPPNSCVLGADDAVASAGRAGYPVHMRVEVVQGSTGVANQDRRGLLRRTRCGHPLPSSINSRTESFGPPRGHSRTGPK
jgi:hypothetical protein